MKYETKITLIVLFAFCSSLCNSQVSYGGSGVYGLRKIIPTYTNSAIQVVRSCDNATTNIGFTSCGDLDTLSLKSFVLASNPLSAITPAAQGAYSLRKLRCAYAGNAINVRRSCDNTTRDIGFNSNGDLDTLALKAFVMAASPLSALSVTAAVAFGLRKLRCAYAGSAIQVRRSSDNATSDIGFTSLGDLDTTALKTFVGGGNSGFVSVWYDQSGSGINVSPPAATNQPRIMNAGVIERRNGLPSIFFDGVNDYFTTNSFPTTGYTGFTANLLAAWTTVGASIGNIQTLIDNDHNCTKGFVVQDRPDLLNRPVTLAVINPTACTTDQIADVLTTGNGALRLITYVNNTTSHAGYRDGNLMGSAVYTGAYVIGTRFLIGAWHSGGSITRFTNGHIQEVNIFRSALSTTDRQYLEWGQAQYYNISGPALSSTLPAAAPSAFVTTWYDQSGNARHATQPANALQPRIINAGLIEKNSSNRPSIFFNGTYLKNSFFLTTQPVSTSCVWRARGITNPGGELFGWGDNGGGGRRYGGWFAFSNATQGTYGVENQGAGIVGSTLLNTNTWYIATQVLPGSSLPALTQWINGTSQAMTNIGSPAAMNIIGGEFAIGTIPTANVQGHNGDIQELVYFSSALTSTERQFIEWSQSQYYGISGPVLVTLPASAPSASVARWYDQSGNGNVLSAAFANQPSIVSSGIIDKQGGRPAIKLNGVSSYLTQSNLSISNPYTANAVATRTANGGGFGYQRLINLSATGDSFGYLGVLNGDYATFTGNGAGTWNDLAANAPNTSVALNTQAILSMAVSTGATGLVPYLNGTAQTAKVGTAATATGFIIGASYAAANTSQLWSGNISEVNIFSSALSTSRRTLLESNESAYYNISTTNNKYTPPTASSYNRFVLGIGRESSTDSVCATRQSAGMGFTVSTNAAAYLKDNSDYIMAGINCPISNGVNTTFLQAPIVLRWDNDWYINKTDVVGTAGGTVSIYFDFSDFRIGATPGVAANYSLLARSSTAVDFSVVPTAVANVLGSRVYFTVDANNIANNASNGGYYTIGTTNNAISILPLELLKFSANSCDKDVCLEWRTANEVNTSYFGIERSADGLNWIKVKNVKAAGSSLQVLNYTAIDEQPLTGISYYRLKLVDADKDFKFSRIAAVDFNKESNINIYPNPSNGLFQITNCDNYNQVIVSDVSGRRVHNSGINSSTFYLELNELQSGYYFVTFINSITGLSQTSKILLDKE